MLKDSDTPRYAVRRTKRTYSADTKAELLAACNAPGASIAAVASANGMNASDRRGCAADQDVLVLEVLEPLLKNR